MAFTSDESGREEVFVVPFPGPGGRIPISSQGGTDPRWRRDGTEIFYMGPRLTLMAAAVNGQNPEFEVRTVSRLFEERFQNRELPGLWPWIGLRRGAGWTAFLDQPRHRHGTARRNATYDRHELDILSARGPMTWVRRPPRTRLGTTHRGARRLGWRDDRLTRSPDGPVVTSHL